MVGFVLRRHNDPANPMRLLPQLLTLIAVTALAMVRARTQRLAAAAGRHPRGDLTLHAQLYKPEGAGPFPMVIALHGCGGLGGACRKACCRATATGPSNC